MSMPEVFMAVMAICWFLLNLGLFIGVAMLTIHLLGRWGDKLLNRMFKRSDA